MKWLRELIRNGHNHRWRGSMFNRYDIAMEETCEKCGDKRHLLTFFDSTHDRYHEGPHPIAVNMRAKGITKNY